MRRHQQQLAVMFIDLDLFKRINDTLGHDVGDEVLIEMAKRLKACVRESDTVSRMGGDEFTILQPEIKDPSNSLQLASRIVASLREPFISGDRELYVTSSVGIAIYPDDGETPEELTKNADTAMYRAPPASRHRARGARSQLPGQGRPGQPANHRRRGAAALEQCRSRPGLASRLHPPRRGQRHDPADRRVGAQARLHAGT
jgi:diguanylate cyclase (GGDEF)-like protein